MMWRWSAGWRTVARRALRERGHRSGFARRLQPKKRADKALTGFGVLICRISAQKPAAPMTYTDLLGTAIFYIVNIKSPFGSCTNPFFKSKFIDVVLSSIGSAIMKLYLLSDFTSSISRSTSFDP